MTEDREHLCSQLSAFLDGQLPPDQAQRVAAALEKDPTLCAELKGLEATRNLVRKLPRESAPASLLGSVMQQIEREHLLTAPATRTGEPLRWVRHLATAAIILLGVGLGVYLYDSLSKPGFPEYPSQSPNLSQPLARGGPDGPTRPSIDDAKKSVDGVIVANKSLPASQAENDPVRPAAPDPLQGLADIAIYLSNDVGFRPDLGQLAVDSQNVVIAAPDPARANRDVQEFLARNNLYNIEATPSPVDANNAKTDNNVVARGNFFSVANVDRQTRYVAYVESSQAVQLASELRRYKQVPTIAQPHSGEAPDTIDGTMEFRSKANLGEQSSPETAPSPMLGKDSLYVAKGQLAARDPELVLPKEAEAPRKEAAGRPDFDGGITGRAMNPNASASGGATAGQGPQAPASAPSVSPSVEVPVTPGNVVLEDKLASVAPRTLAPATMPAGNIVVARPSPVAVAQAAPAPAMSPRASTVPSSSPTMGLDIAATGPASIASQAGDPSMESEATTPESYGKPASQQADAAGVLARHSGVIQPTQPAMQHELRLQASTAQAAPLLRTVQESQPTTQSSQPTSSSLANAAVTLGAQQQSASQPAPPPLGRLTRLVIIVDEQPTSQATQAK